MRPINALAVQLVYISVCATLTLSRAASLSLVQPEWGYYFEQDQGESSYSFGYDVEDGSTGNAQFRRERRLPNGTVTGSYGLVEPDGNVRVAHYTADHNGYRVTIENSQRPDEQHPPPPDGLASPPPASDAFRHAMGASWPPPPPPDDRRTPPARDYTTIWKWDSATADKFSGVSQRR